MIIRENAREVVLQCDGCTVNGCESVFYADTAGREEARLMAEAHGWAFGLDDDHDAFDYCPKCKPETL
jgi:hypothetical protein